MTIADRVRIRSRANAPFIGDYRIKIIKKGHWSSRISGRSFSPLQGPTQGNLVEVFCLSFTGTVLHLELQNS